MYRLYKPIPYRRTSTEVWKFPISKLKQFPIIDETISYNWHVIHTRFCHILDVLLLRSAIEWALETCTLISQLFEICLNPAAPRDLWRWAGVQSGLWCVNGLSWSEIEVRRRAAKFVALKVCLGQLELSSPYLYLPLVLISSAGCKAGLRSKTTSAHGLLERTL